MTSFRLSRIILGAGLALACQSFTTQAAEWGLKRGTPELQSAGPLAFGPDGILLVGDTEAAAVVAIDTEQERRETKPALNVDGLNRRIVEAVGRRQVTINDVVVSPVSGNAFVSIAVRGDKFAPLLFSVNEDGDVTAVPLSDVKFSQVRLPNPPEEQVGRRKPQTGRPEESITDLAWFEGKVLVSGMTNEQGRPSSVREIAFPFADADGGINVEIFHPSHGRFEDYAAVRAFVPIHINGEPTLLMGFTCTPLVKFPLSSLSESGTVRGQTIAELGNRNRPIDMIVYRKGDEDFLLMANTTRGVMKFSTEGIHQAEGITKAVPQRGDTAGHPYETIEELRNVVQLDRLNDKQAVILVQNDRSFDLKTIELP